MLGSNVMAKILGAGCTHCPLLITPDEDRNFPINITLSEDERLPEELKNPLPAGADAG